MAQTTVVNRQELLRELPHDERAERTMLGSMMLGLNGVGEAFEMLTAEDFADSRHQVIYRSLRDLWSRNMAGEMIYSDLEASGSMERAGGVPYVSSLIDGLPHRQNIPDFQQRIRSKRVLRDLAAVFNQAKNSVFDVHRSGEDPGQLIDDILERVASIGKMSGSEDRGETAHDAAVSLLTTLDKDTSLRILTDVGKVDEITGGFRSGELILVTAETGVGKSFMALQIKRRSCRDQHHSLYCSGEMSAEHLMGRVVASESGVSSYKLRRPETMQEGDLVRLLEHAGRQCHTCRIIDGDLTLARIRGAARAMASNHDLGVVIVDYDELVEVRGKDEWDQQRILVRSLKSLAIELKIPVVMVSQLRKPLEGSDVKKPTLQRIYGSGAKSKHSSIVIHVDRPFVRDLKGDETAATIFILKSRDGRLGRVPCKFNIKTLRFEDLPPEPEEGN